jgi:hypothetical protein
MNTTRIPNTFPRPGSFTRQIASTNAHTAFISGLRRPGDNLIRVFVILFVDGLLPRQVTQRFLMYEKVANRNTPIRSPPVQVTLARSKSILDTCL